MTTRSVLLTAAIASAVLQFTACTPNEQPQTSRTEPTSSVPSSTASTSATGQVVHISAAAAAGGDGSAARPFRTIQQGVDQAPTGSTVLVSAGAYAGFAVTRDGVTISAAPGALVSVRGGADDVIEFDGVSGGAIDGLDVTGSQVRYGSGVKIDSSSGVVVRNSRVHDARTFGIVVVRSSNVVLQHNEIYGNADGIEERQASNLVIRANRIHSNLKEVDSGRGQEGINFYQSTGRVIVEWNSLWNNGTHFEVYGASNLVFRYNHLHSGQVMETGTTSGLPCAHNVFVRNVAYRGARKSSGLILRCAQDMLVAHNVLDGFDQFAFDVIDGLKGVAYGGSVERLRIVDNVVVRGRAHSIDSALPKSVVIDYNLVSNAGSTAQYGDFLCYVSGKGNARTLAQFRSWTGYEHHGISTDPRFVDGAHHDYHLTTGSLAINRGIVVLGESFKGTAPDLGRYEQR